MLKYESSLQKTADIIVHDRIKEFNNFKYDYKESAGEMCYKLFKHPKTTKLSSYEYYLTGILINKYEFEYIKEHMDLISFPYVKVNDLIVAHRTLYKISMAKQLLVYFPALIYERNSKTTIYFNTPYYDSLYKKYLNSLGNDHDRATDLAIRAYNNKVLKKFKIWLKGNVSICRKNKARLHKGWKTLVCKRDQL